MRALIGGIVGLAASIAIPATFHGTRFLIILWVIVGLGSAYLLFVGLRDVTHKETTAPDPPQAAPRQILGVGERLFSVTGDDNTEVVDTTAEAVGSVVNPDGSTSEFGLLKIGRIGPTPQQSETPGERDVQPAEAPPRRNDFISTIANEAFARLETTQRGKTKLQAASLVAPSIGRTIKFEGDVYSVNPHPGVGISIGFEFSSYTVFAFFDDEDASALMALSRGDRVVIEGNLQDAEPGSYTLAHCELLGISPRENT